MGHRVYQIGAKIIEVIIDAAKEYPDTATTVVGGVLTFLTWWIPVLGPVLAPLVGAVSALISLASFIKEFVKKQFKAARRALAG